MRPYETLLAGIIVVCLHESPVWAQDWVLTSAPTNLTWVPVAMSADGSKLAAAATNGPIYLSTNFGASWQLSKAPLQNWSAIASSADGTKLVAVAGSYLGVGPIYTSTNSGLDWISNATPRRAWRCVASSADGTKLLAGANVYDFHGQVYSGPLFTSTNSGANWQSNNVPQEFWVCVASSADGLKLVAGSEAGRIYTSSNFGASWRFRSLASFPPWTSVACSADGSIMAATFYDHFVYLSTDSGATWSQSSAIPWAYSVILSGDDRRIGVQSPDAFLVSQDAGSTWDSMPSQTYPDSWSADGRRWVGRTWSTNSPGGPDIGGISTFQSAQSPRIIINPNQFGLTLSWLVPSSTVSLQQSLDVGSATWETVTNTPYLNLSNLQNEVVLPTAGSRGFYRLSEP